MMFNKNIFLLMFSFFISVFSAPGKASVADYRKLAYIDQTLIFGLGISYTKMETFTDVGNYFLLSQTNPRLTVRYISKVEESFRHHFYAYYVRELYAPENPSFFLRQRDPLNRFGIMYQPHWFSNSGGASYGFNFQLRQANVYSELPRASLLVGNISQRFSYEAGVAVKFYGQTVSKQPMSLDLDFSYVNHLSVNSPIEYNSGISYRVAVDFDFARRSYFSNFNLRAFYEFEKIESEFRPITTKELGFSVARAFSF